MSNGINYFPLDVHLDDAFELIEAEFGLTGFAIIVKLYQKIYSLGYYCEWTKDVALLFSKKEGCSAVSEIVSAAIRRGIFDKKLYEKYQILTSAGIQKRYFEIVSRRKKVDVKTEYLLIDVTHFSKNVNILGKNVNIFDENVNIFQQRKEKERKGKKIKESVEKSVAFSPPTLEDVKKYISENKYNVNAERFVSFYTSKNWYVGKNKMKDWKAAVRGWHSKEVKNAQFNDYSLKTSYDYDEIENRALMLGRSEGK